MNTTPHYPNRNTKEKKSKRTTRLIETQSAENFKTTDINTTKQMLTREDKINVMFMKIMTEKKIILQSLRN